MPRSFLVKSQESRDKEKKHGIGIAKLVYDPTRAATVITTLAKPEPRRPVITFAQANIHPKTVWKHSWISPSSMTSSCPMPIQSYVIKSKVKENPTTSTVPTHFFRPFLPLPIPSRQPYVTNGHLSGAVTSFSSDEEGRLSSPGSDCGETFQEKKGFNRRMNPRKSGQKLKCADCGKEYCTAGGLNKHQQTQCRARQNGRTFQCKYCPKEYTALGALKMHLRTHTLPCKCGLCGKAFSRPWLLQGHIRTHTGEKPFSCPHCQRAFADRSNLRAHLQTHTQIKRYSCSLCSRTFSRMSLLNKHTKSGCDRMKGTLQPHTQTEDLTIRQ